MSKLYVDQVDPKTGTSLTLGSSGDTVTLGSGASSSGFGPSLTGSTNNTVTTVTGANAIQGEANLTWDGSSLGVGIASPETTAHIKSASGECELRLTAASTSDARLRFGDTDDTDKGYIGYSRDTGIMTFSTNNAGGADMQILAASAVKCNSRLIVGDDGDSSYGVNIVRGGNAGENGCYFNDKDGQSSYEFFTFRRQGTQIGFIRRDGSNDAVTYSTTSDYRLKDGIVDKTDGIEKLKQLKPRKFYWKSNEDKTLVDGFLAHEVSSVVPEAIGGEKDEVEKNEDGTNKLDDEGNTIPRYQGIDQSKLVPLLTSALQEAITKIETLEAKVTALESA